MNTTICKKWVFVSLMVFAVNIYARDKIAIVDFELADLTLLPKTLKELKRTASIKPMLEQDLKLLGNYEIISISRQEQTYANAGVGYLFQHDDSSGELGKKFGADWIVVGLHRKPSFLYSHILVHIINAKTNKLEGDLLIEMKGSDEKVTQRAVSLLARQINELIK
jgi:hypothetical protein